MPDSPKVKHNSSNLFLIQRQAYTKLTLREETRISLQQFFSPAYSPKNTIALYCSLVKNTHVAIYLLLFLQYSKESSTLSSFLSKEFKHCVNFRFDTEKI